MESKTLFYRSMAARILIMAILVSLMLICCSLFWPRFLYQEGNKQLNLKHYDKAIHYLDRAENGIPEFLAQSFAQAEIYRTYTNYGQALYHKGIRDWKDSGPSIKNYTLLRKGKIYLTKADAIFPITYRNFYWLTKTEEALERVHQYLFPKLKNPYDALNFYQKSLQLRPAGRTIRYAYIRYLTFKKRDKKIPGAVEKLMAVYPPAYYSFIDEIFIPSIEKGLKSALEKDVMPGSAAAALSSLYEQTKEFPKAVYYYLIYMELELPANTADSYIHLGRLYLKQEKDEQAFASFEKSLQLTGNTLSAIKSIFRILKAERRSDVFFHFLARLPQKGIQIPDTTMTLARIHMDMKQYDQAKEILSRITASKKADAKAYALLAEIAHAQKDWNEMELSAQKAIRLDQDNDRYYYTLAQSLWAQEKYKRVELEVTSAIEYAPMDNPWYFRLRAKALWVQGKYALAVLDWEKAFNLKPDRSDFAFRVALGCEKLAQFDKAQSYIEKAISLAPNNQKYKTLQKRLRANKRSQYYRKASNE